MTDCDTCVFKKVIVGFFSILLALQPTGDIRVTNTFIPLQPLLSNIGCKDHRHCYFYNRVGNLHRELQDKSMAGYHLMWKYRSKDNPSLFLWNSMGRAFHKSYRSGPSVVSTGDFFTFSGSFFQDYVRNLK